MLHRTTSTFSYIFSEILLLIPIKIYLLKIPINFIQNLHKNVYIIYVNFSKSSSKVFPIFRKLISKLFKIFSKLKWEKRIFSEAKKQQIAHLRRKLRSRFCFLEIFRNEIKTILTLSTSDGGEWGLSRSSF